MIMECSVVRQCALCGVDIKPKVKQIQIVRHSKGGPYLQGACAVHVVADPRKVPEHKEKQIESICATAVEYVEAGMGIREAIGEAKKLYGWRD